MQTFSYGKTTWVHAMSPDEEQLRTIVDTYGIDPRISNELITPSSKPHLEIIEDGYYLVIHYPQYNGHDKTVTSYEINIVRHRDTVITVAYEQDEVIHQFTKEAEAASTLLKEEKTRPISAQGIIDEILARMYRSTENEVKVCEDWMSDIEEKVFHGMERQMVYELSRIGRHLIHLYSILSYHGHLIQELQRVRRTLDRSSEAEQTVLNAYRRTFTRLESARLVHLEIRRTNEDLLNMKRNEVMHSLTLITFLFFPLTIIAGIFGMNTVVPFEQSPAGFLYIVGIMTAAVLVIYLFFKFRKWM
jgi:magnesium transporter